MSKTSPRNPQRQGGRKGADAGPAQPVPSSLSHPERSELQRQGAKAAARGESLQTNPMSRSVNSPPETGEAMDDWSRRARAWQDGHDAQTAAAQQSGHADHTAGSDDGHD